MSQEQSGVFVFNPEAKRPACVLLAAAIGGNPEFARYFASELWIVQGPEVDGLKRFGPMTHDQVRDVADRLGVSR